MPWCLAVVLWFTLILGAGYVAMFLLLVRKPFCLRCFKREDRWFAEPVCWTSPHGVGHPHVPSKELS